MLEDADADVDVDVECLAARLWFRMLVSEVWLLLPGGLEMLQEQGLLPHVGQSICCVYSGARKAESVVVRYVVGWLSVVANRVANVGAGYRDGYVEWMEGAQGLVAGDIYIGLGGLIPPHYSQVGI